MTPSACPGCGAVVLGGGPGCQTLYDELRSLIDNDPAFGTFARVAHDTYCLQHPTRYIGDRPKALAAHLGALCWAVEYGSHPTGYRALQRWLERVPWRTVPMPGLPDYRGDITVVTVYRELQETVDPTSVGRAVERWAHSTWEAYAELHPLIRGWIEIALNMPGSRHR